MHLIDFGLSVLNTKKQSNKIVGTHEFMSINSHLKMCHEQLPTINTDKN